MEEIPHVAMDEKGYLRPLLITGTAFLGLTFSCCGGVGIKGYSILDQSGILQGFRDRVEEKVAEKHGGSTGKPIEKNDSQEERKAEKKLIVNTCEVKNEISSTSIHCGEESDSEKVAVEIKDGILSVRASFQVTDNTGNLITESVEVTSNQIGPGLALQGTAQWEKDAAQEISSGTSSTVAQNWLANLSCNVSSDQHAVHCTGEKGATLDVYAPNTVEVRGPSENRTGGPYVDLSVTSTQYPNAHVIFAKHPEKNVPCEEVTVLEKPKEKEEKGRTTASK